MVSLYPIPVSYLSDLDEKTQRPETNRERRRNGRERGCQEEENSRARENGGNICSEGASDSNRGTEPVVSIFPVRQRLRNIDNGGSLVSGRREVRRAYASMATNSVRGRLAFGSCNSPPSHPFVSIFLTISVLSVYASTPATAPQSR